LEYFHYFKNAFRYVIIMKDSVLHLRFKVKEDLIGLKDLESLSNKLTDVTDDKSFCYSQVLENQVLPEFEDLNISDIPRCPSFVSILKSSVFEEELDENPKNRRLLQIETNQIESRMFCSPCMGSLSSPCCLF
jgi:hypothetical protein